MVGKSGGDAQQVAERGFVSGGSFVQRFYVLARDDKNVRGRLRVDVAYGYRAVIRVYNVRGNLARYDSTKETIHKDRDK